MLRRTRWSSGGGVKDTRQSFCAETSSFLKVKEEKNNGKEWMTIGETETSKWRHKKQVRIHDRISQVRWCKIDHFLAEIPRFWKKNAWLTDGRTIRWTDQRTNRRTDQLTNGWTNQRTDGPTDQLTDRRTDKASFRDAWTHLKTIVKGRRPCQPSYISIHRSCPNLPRLAVFITKKHLLFDLHRCHRWVSDGGGRSRRFCLLILI